MKPVMFCRNDSLWVYSCWRDDPQLLHRNERGMAVCS